MEMNKKTSLSTNKHVNTKYRRIITNVNDFIQQWNLKKISISDTLRLPDIKDQYMFDDGSLFCSACTKYSEHGFNNTEILWENSKSSDIENKMKSNLSDSRRLYLQ